MNHRLQRKSRRAFTLIELLVVIAIIGILAGLILAGAAAVKGKAEKSRAKTELSKLTLLIDQYHSKKGFYPPGNQLYPLNDRRRWTHTPLFYELSGTVKTNLPAPGFITLNGLYKISANGANSVQSSFGMPGFMNSSLAGGGSAEPFLADLKSESMANVGTTASPVYVLAVGVSGPDEITAADGKSYNLWYYNLSSPTNNPNSYDLWADIEVQGETWRVSNWSEEPVKP